MDALEWINKVVKRQRLANNRVRGHFSEMGMRMNGLLSGHQVNRTGRGSDFSMQKVEPFTNKKIGRKFFVEVKSGGSMLSKRQKEMQKKLKGRYKVIRTAI